MASQFKRQYQYDIAQQPTCAYPVVAPSATTEQPSQPLLLSTQFTSITTEFSDDLVEDTLQDDHHPEEETEEQETTKKPSKLLRPIMILVLIGVGCALYFIWRPASANSTTPILSQSFSTSTNKGNTSSSTTNSTSGGTIQVYIAGAVQHPGVYTLSSDARVYQLLEAAGGPLPDANLVLLNLAEKLVDGQEIYVSRIGETPPAIGSTTNNSNNQGQLVNINTASVSDLEQKLHLSSKSAQAIVNYRQQYGPYTAVDQLLQVVSKTIYDRIKDQVTV